MKVTSPKKALIWPFANVPKFPFFSFTGGGGRRNFPKVQNTGLCKDKGYAKTIQTKVILERIAMTNISQFFQA